MRTDEDEVRAVLRTYSAPVPLPPADRADLAVRRAGGIRRRRTAAMALALVLPVVAGGVLVTRPTHVPDYTTVAAWPERAEPGFDGVKSTALAEWQEHHMLGEGETLRWLWAGHVPNTNYDGVAFATCAADACSRTVMAFANQNSSRTPDDDPEVTAWRLVVQDLVPGQPAAPLSYYLEGEPVSGKNGATTVLFVLPAPDAASVTYASPERGGRGGAAGSLERYGALFSGNVGFLAADAMVTVRDPDGDLLHEGPVGDGTAVGRAEQIRGIDLPRGFAERSSSWGQIERDGPTGHSYEPVVKDPLALFVRCVGTAPARVTYNGLVEVVPCDGDARLLGPRQAVIGAFQWMLTSEDPYAVYIAVLAESDY